MQWIDQIVRKFFKTKCKNAFMIFACFHFCEFFFRFFIFSAADLIFWWTSTIFRFDENFVKFDTRFWLSSKFIKTLAFFNTFEAFIFKFCIRTIVNNIEFMTTDTRQCCSSRIISRFYKGESIGIRDTRGFQNFKWGQGRRNPNENSEVVLYGEPAICQCCKLSMMQNDNAAKWRNADVCW